MEEEHSDVDLDPLPASNAHAAPFESPLPASVLLNQQLARQEELRRRGSILTGCSELDQYVLLGGLDRGSVVGISAEDDDVGLRVGFFREALSCHILVCVTRVHIGLRGICLDWTADGGAIACYEAGREGYDCDDPSSECSAA